MDGSPIDLEQVLIVDDDDDIRELIACQLEQAHLESVSAGTIAEARKLVNARGVSVILLDLMLPDGSGLDYCRHLRRTGCEAAIMILTARGSTIDRIEGLEGGADDYLTKPFEPRELVARVKNLMMRAPVRSASSAITRRFAKFGPWRLDLVRRRLVAPSDDVVMVSTSEFDILKRFIEAPREELGREDLVPERKETVWLDRSLDNRICRLRNKLAAVPGGEELIVTVRSRGFLLACDVIYE